MEIIGLLICITTEAVIITAGTAVISNSQHCLSPLVTVTVPIQLQMQLD